MAFSTKLTLQGFDEYLERIAAAGRDIDEAVVKALLTGAEIIQEEMQSLAPVDTGNLRDHIKIKGPKQDGNYFTVEIGVIHDKNFTDANTARYANAQEYGWIGHKIIDEHTTITVVHAGRSYIRAGRDRSARRARIAMRDSLEEDGIL